VRSFADTPFTLPPDGNNATGRPVARGIERARRGGSLYSEETAAHCPSLGDSVRHGNVRHIRSALAARGANLLSDRPFRREIDLRVAEVLLTKKPPAKGGLFPVHSYIYERSVKDKGQFG
jgi:hypothetical protein